MFVDIFLLDTMITLTKKLACDNSFIFKATALV